MPLCRFGPSRTSLAPSSVKKRCRISGVYGMTARRSRSTPNFVEAERDILQYVSVRLEAEVLHETVPLDSSLC